MTGSGLLHGGWNGRPDRADFFARRDRRPPHVTSAANRGNAEPPRRIERFALMNIDPLTGLIAVSLAVALLCHLWPPPPDDHNGPGETAP
jgi:hypothetical protein